MSSGSTVTPKRRVQRALPTELRQADQRMICQYHAQEPTICFGQKPLALPSIESSSFPKSHAQDGHTMTFRPGYSCDSRSTISGRMLDNLEAVIFAVIRACRENLQILCDV